MAAKGERGGKRQGLDPTNLQLCICASHVLGTELVVNDLEVLHRVDAVFDMDNVRVLKRAAHVEDAIHSL